MSEINSFSDYTNKYNSNVDYSALFGGTSNSSSLSSTNILSDYASIKNGSYGKLLKAYYAKQDAEKTAGTGDTSQKLTLMKTSADSLKKSADALNASSLWEKKKIKKKDEETGEETEVEDYDWEAITRAVKSFIEDYNDVVKEAGESIKTRQFTEPRNKQTLSGVIVITRNNSATTDVIQNARSQQSIPGVIGITGSQFVIPGKFSGFIRQYRRVGTGRDSYFAAGSFQ